MVGTESERRISVEALAESARPWLGGRAFSLDLQLTNDLGMDSVDKMDFCMRLEALAEIDLDDAVVFQVKTFRELLGETNAQ